MASKKSNRARPEYLHGEDRYRIEDDLRTLQRAAEVKGDSKRLKAAMDLHEDQRRGMQSIVGERPASKSTTHRQRLVHRKI